MFLVSCLACLPLPLSCPVLVLSCLVLPCLVQCCLVSSSLVLLCLLQSSLVQWLPWPGTAYAVPQYPAVPDFFVVAPSDEKTVIGYKVRGGRSLDGKLRMSAFCRCVDWPKKRMDGPFFFESPAPTPSKPLFSALCGWTLWGRRGYCCAVPVDLQADSNGSPSPAPPSCV